MQGMINIKKSKDVVSNNFFAPADYFEWEILQNA